MTSWISGELEATLSCTPDIGGTIHIFFGLDNASISPEQVDEIETTLTKYNISCQVLRYQGVNHRFFCNQ